LLNNLRLPSYANQIWEFSGIDHIDLCHDKNHFLSYPHTLDYCYNSRGFRDTEWPEDLKSSVWCVGDSFTAGIGSPFDHIWPQVLAQNTGRRTINISMDGASNEWIARQVCKIYSEVQPHNIVIMWSYIHRREDPNTTLSDLDRRIYQIKSTEEQDFANLMSCRNLVHDYCTNSNIVDLVIPGCWPSYFPHVVLDGASWRDTLPSSISELKALSAKLIKIWQTKQNPGKKIVDLNLDSKQLEIQQQQAKFCLVTALDFARDRHHFDVNTSKWAADQIAPRLRL